MKKIIKRIMCFLLSLVLILGLMPGMTKTSRAAAADIPNSNLTWELSGGTLTISGTGPMPDYDFGYAPWFSSSSNIQNVVINSGVTSIGQNAFNMCTNLSSITISGSVTSIGYRAFYYIKSSATLNGDLSGIRFFGGENEGRLALTKTGSATGGVMIKRVKDDATSGLYAGQLLYATMEGDNGDVLYYWTLDGSTAKMGGYMGMDTYRYGETCNTSATVNEAGGFYAANGYAYAAARNYGAAATIACTAYRIVNNQLVQIGTSGNVSLAAGTGTGNTGPELQNTLSGLNALLLKNETTGLKVQQLLGRAGVTHILCSDNVSIGSSVTSSDTSVATVSGTGRSATIKPQGKNGTSNISYQIGTGGSGKNGCFYHGSQFYSSLYTGTIGVCVIGADVTSTSNKVTLSLEGLPTGTGAKTVCTINDATHTSITSTGKNSDTVTFTGLEPTTKYTILIEVTDPNSLTGTHKAQATTVATTEAAPAHTHEFTYSASGDTITATCSADGCPLTNKQATLTIGAPALTTFGGTGSAEATITDADSIKGEATVSYYQANEAGTDKIGTALGSAPTNAGKYWAEITLGGATAHVVYTIALATLTGVSVAQSGTLTYNGSAQTPTVATAATTVNSQTVTFTYSKTSGGPYGAMPTVTGVSDCGTFYYKASAPNHSDATGSFTVSMSPKSLTPSLSGAVSKVYDGGNSVTGATSNTLGITLTGVEGSDNVSATIGSAAYSNADKGENKSVTASGITLSGVDAGNYTLSDTTVSASVGTITQRPITIKASDQTVEKDSSITTYASDHSMATVTTGTLVSGQTLDSVTLTGSGTTSVTDSGTITPSNAVIKSGSTDVTSNYDITYADGVLTVVPIAASVANAPTAKGNKTYDGSPYELVNAGSGVVGGALKYAVTTSDSNTAPTSGWSTTVPSETDAGTYYVWYYVDASANNEYSDSAKTKLGPVTIAPADMTLTLDGTDVSVQHDGQAHGVTVSVTGGAPTDGTTLSVTYSTAVDGTYSVTSPTFTAAGVYTVYYKVTPNSTNYNPVAGTATLTIAGAGITGTAKLAQTLNAVLTPAGGSPTYVWYRGDSESFIPSDSNKIDSATNVTYTLAAADIGKYIKVVITNGGTSYTSTAVGPILKKDGPVAPADATTAGFVPNYRTETFIVNNDYEVSTTNNNDGTGVILNSSLTAALDRTAKVYIRKKETADTQPGTWLEVSLTARPAAPTGLTTENATNSSTTDGKIKGVNDTMEYKLRGSTGEWTIAGGTDIAVKPGTYQVRVKATDDVPHGFAAEVTVGSKPSGGGGGYTPVNPTSAPTAKPTTSPTTSPTSAPSAAPIASSAPAPQPTSNTAPTSAPASSPEPYTIPVENESSVPVEASITEGTAKVNEITEDTINQVTQTGGEQGTAAQENTLLIDLSGATQTVTGVELSKTTVERLAVTTTDGSNKIDTVTVRMTNAIVELDSKTLTAVNEQAAGSSIRLVVDGTQLTDLNDAQQQAVNNYNSAVTPTTFDAYFESDGNRISDFKGGTAKVSYKYDIPAGFSPYFFHMLFLNLTGQTERYTTTYAAGWISGLLSHFSDYAIVYDDTILNADGVLAMDPYSGMDKTEWNMDKSDFIDDDTTVLPNGATAYDNGIAINSELKVYQTKDEITIHWGKVKGATGYKIYAGYCGPKMPKKPIKIVKKAPTVKVEIKKLNGKKLKPKKNYKFCVVAFKTVEGVDKVLGRTVTAHIVGKKNKKYSNPKKLTLAKSQKTLKVGKKFKIKAKVTLVNKKRKSLSDKHAPMFRYVSTNKAVATVDKNGTVKAIGKGTCYIWVYAKNGYGKKVKITVK